MQATQPTPQTEQGHKPWPSPIDERRLIAAAQAGGEQARADLIDAFMPRIAWIARTYRAYPSVDREELLQEGVVGLLRALERYDPTRGTPFWAYAGWWVRQAMQQLVAELTWPTVLSDRALRHLSRVKQAHRAALAESGREPSRDELATRAGLEVKQLDNLLTVDRVPRSTEVPVATQDGAVGTLGDLLADPAAESEYDRVIDAIASETLDAQLTTLSDRERMILRARFGLDGKEETLAEIASRLGVTGERVRQIEQRALGKLAAAWEAPAEEAVAA
jgi:RNA polymerase sigma factor (sigma-70 family)